mmetsp:Transcript_9649/g.24964  ORF Transcript_9649/g.24964 Transcript_9649/m.24964 type:complete len:171 (-) Transcript_9649:345-857(-)
MMAPNPPRYGTPPPFFAVSARSVDSALCAIPLTRSCYCPPAFYARAQRRLEFRSEARETRSRSRRKIEMPHPATSAARPVRTLPLGAAGKRKRVAGAAAASGNADERQPTMDEQSTRLPCHYLQAHMFIKRRLYIESQDPRLLWQAKALEGELRRRMHSAMSALASSACS